MLQWPWKKKKQPEPVEDFSQSCSPEAPDALTPDSPLPFGYKTGWLCIQSDDPQTVMEALSLWDSTPCNWAEGLKQAGEGGKVFVSPSLDGYVLVVGWTEEKLENLSPLAAGSPQLQYFASHRVADYYAWAKYEDGKLLRGYAYVGDRDEVAWDQGELTPEEIALGAERFPKMGEECDWDEVEFPDEETVLALAAAWGVDTSFEEKEYPAALGWVAMQ